MPPVTIMKTANGRQEATNMLIGRLTAQSDERLLRAIVPSFRKRLGHSLGIVVLTTALFLAGCAGSSGNKGGVPDPVLTRAVEAQWDTVTGLNDRLDVTVRDGRALLTGRAATADERVEAVRLAWQVNGVKEVINEVEIGDESSLSDKATDAWITTQLRTKLLTDSDITSGNYTIETINQTVHLMGRARSQVELDRVREYARNIARVRQVVSHVVVPY
jgi:osmotically-inducible protein OsmY